MIVTIATNMPPFFYDQTGFPFLSSQTFGHHQACKASTNN
jgi:hypothetical protein